MSLRDGVVGAAVGAVLSAVLAVPTSYYVGHRLASAQDQIDRPGSVDIHPVKAPRAFVGRTVAVSGTAEIPNDTDLLLWIVIRVDVNDATTFYPQGRAIVDTEGRWECVVTLGSPAESDDGPYTVMAQLVDSTTAARYRDYARNDLATDDDGMDGYDSDEVIRLEAMGLQRDISLPGVTKEEIGTCT